MREFAKASSPIKKSKSSMPRLEDRFELATPLVAAPPLPVEAPDVEALSRVAIVDGIIN